MRAVVFILPLITAAAAADVSPSPVVYPIQRLPLHFSHSQHLVLPDVGCGTCHEQAADSKSSADVLLPTEDACTACHEIDRGEPEKVAQPAARCDACHAGFRAEAPIERAVMPPPHIAFNHQLHVKQKLACASCHDVAEVGLATRAELPRMAFCLGCHDGTRAPSACTTCHPAAASSRLQTQFAEGQLLPSGALRGDAHDLGFRTGHARVAQNDERYCANCHSRAYCQDCHNGRTKPLDLHGGDYVTMHALDARRHATTCEGCHRQQTFCVGCHARTGVSEDKRTSEFRHSSSPTPGMPDHLFHPSDWLHVGHPREAQRNLRQCTSCHREDYCVSCHLGGGPNNPHGGGWAGSARCKALAARSSRTCFRCHTNGDKINECQ